MRPALAGPGVHRDLAERPDAPEEERAAREAVAPPVAQEQRREPEGGPPGQARLPQPLARGGVVPHPQALRGQILGLPGEAPSFRQESFEERAGGGVGHGGPPEAILDGR